MVGFDGHGVNLRAQFGVRLPDAIGQQSDEAKLIRADTDLPHSTKKGHRLRLDSALCVRGDHGGEGGHVGARQSVEHFACVGEAAEVEVGEDEGVGEAGVAIFADLGDGGVDGAGEGEVAAADREAEEAERGRGEGRVAMVAIDGERGRKERRRG